MKKKLLAVVLCMLFGIQKGYACDICGSGVSNYNAHLSPHLSKNFVGYSYVRRVYRTHAHDGTWNTERYNAILVTGQYSPTKRIQVGIIVPFQYNRLNGAEEVKNLGGLGDITLLGNYKLWDQMTKTRQQTLTGGIGVKLPTGYYTHVDKEDQEEQNFQLGTGSMDYLLQGAYRYALSGCVFSATVSYKYNTQNGDDYRFGDVFAGGVTAAYRKNWDNLSLLPCVLIMTEYYMPDADKHILHQGTGGHVLYAGGGLDVNTRKVAAGINYQVAPVQKLALGQIRVEPRLSAHVSFVF
jgi:hypothetical protein